MATRQDLLDQVDLWIEAEARIAATTQALAPPPGTSSEPTHTITMEELHAMR